MTFNIMNEHISVSDSMATIETTPEPGLHPPSRGFDPRTQLAALAAINTVTFASSAPSAQLAAAGLALAALLWQGAYRRCLRFCLLYAAAAALLAASLAYPSPLTGVIAFACIVLCKGLPVYMFAAGIVVHTPVATLTAALRSARVPRPVVIVLAVTIRFFPTLRQEFGLVLDGLRMRGLGVSPVRIVRHPLLAVENVLVPLMVRMANISEEVAATAVVRGLDSPRPRVALLPPRAGMADIALLACAALLAAMAFWPAGAGR